jgi:hypothetical protein
MANPKSKKEELIDFLECQMDESQCETNDDYWDEAFKLQNIDKFDEIRAFLKDFKTEDKYIQAKLDLVVDRNSFKNFI